MKWFKDCKTEEEIKSLYRKLAKENHPDKGGNTQTMQSINKEYSYAIALILSGQNLNADEMEASIKMNEAYREAVEKISSIEGIIIELVGNWIWVSGNTFPVKAQLKEANFKFAPVKKLWFFRTAEFKAPNRHNMPMEEIKNKYGSETISGRTPRASYLG